MKKKKEGYDTFNGQEMRGLGYDVSQFATADIEQSFVLLENIERLHEQRQKVQQLIKLHILPFDASLAERLIEDNERLDGTVMAMGESFSNRLREMNEESCRGKRKAYHCTLAKKYTLMNYLTGRQKYLKLKSWPRHNTRR